MFQVASTIEKVETRKDNCLKLVIGTQELSAEQKAIVMGLYNKLGYFLFKESTILEEDIPEEEPEFRDRKSDSQRLRNHLFVYWKKLNELGKTKQTFETFKHEWYEKKFEAIKLSLDEL